VKIFVDHRRQDVAPGIAQKPPWRRESNKIASGNPGAVQPSSPSTAFKSHQQEVTIRKVMCRYSLEHAAGKDGGLAAISACPSSDDLRPIRHFEKEALAHQGLESSALSPGAASRAKRAAPRLNRTAPHL
jgi:hypothetical protein